MVYEQQQSEQLTAVRPGATVLRPRPIVMVVEDNEDDYFLLQRAFSKLEPNADLTRFPEAAETLEYLASAKENPVLFPSLLLLDLKLPGLSGFEILKRIRQDPVFKLLVVNILTSSAEPSDVQQAFQLGANAYTVKPMGINKYEELLSSLLKFWLELSQLPTCDK